MKTWVDAGLLPPTENIEKMLRDEFHLPPLEEGDRPEAPMIEVIEEEDADGDAPDTPSDDEMNDDDQQAPDADKEKKTDANTRKNKKTARKNAADGVDASIVTTAGRGAAGAGGHRYVRRPSAR